MKRTKEVLRVRASRYANLRRLDVPRHLALRVRDYSWENYKQFVQDWKAGKYESSLTGV